MGPKLDFHQAEIGNTKLQRIPGDKSNDLYCSSNMRKFKQANDKDGTPITAIQQSIQVPKSGL